MLAGSGRFPPVDGSMPRLAPAAIFGRCEADLGRGDDAGDSLSVGSAGTIRHLLAMTPRLPKRSGYR